MFIVLYLSKALYYSISREFDQASKSKKKVINYSGDYWSFIFSLSISKRLYFLGSFFFLIIFGLKSNVIRPRPPTVRLEKLCLYPLSGLCPQYDHLETETLINPYELNSLQLNGDNWTIWKPVLPCNNWRINMAAERLEPRIQRFKNTAITIILRTC